MKLVITGATGNLGGLVIDHLLKKIPGSQIIAVVRKLDQAASLTEAGLEVRQGDYNDPETLRAAFEGEIKLLFVSSPDTDDPLRIVQHANVIKAARDAGIRHIVYTSFAFAEENPFALVHMATEYAIRATRIPYTFLRNGGYAEFFINDHLQENVERGAIVTNTGTGRVNAVSRSDLALAAATVLTGEGHENKEYTLVSNHPWSFDELAEVLSEVSGKHIIHQKVSFDEEKAMLVQAGLSESLAQTTAFIYNSIAQGTMEKTTDDLHQLIGHQTTVKELITKALQA
ncbi:SDR family oxidoreductase [Paenibacillus cineris]|uniref:NAD(P)-dependent oxidoreductase n=1 Tax=Paenibacillus cineris TaxID=237530 RepID=A0ABQ4LCQ9_9BACL|nr:SDR family oxidoreductase [Paenibacillus cineris]GIO54216.1 NAD(P)-dependent oxidoreductase [Paenibacillus cineris]